MKTILLAFSPTNRYNKTVDAISGEVDRVKNDIDKASNIDRKVKNLFKAKYIKNMA